MKTKWEATPPDYYGAGKTAGQLAFQVVGDVASIIPIVKGAMVAVKLSGTVLKTTIQQVLKGEIKAGVKVFKRGVTTVTNEVLAKRIAACADGIKCFPAGTLVVMADGTRKPIEQIVAGERVLADDPTDSRPPAPQLVESVQTSRTQYLTYLQLEAKNNLSPPPTLVATNEHPVWTVEDGWIAIRNVRPGQHLIDANGLPVAVLATTEKRHTCGTWNLTVAHTHAFFVDAGGLPVLVHNTTPGPRTYIVYLLRCVYNGVTYGYVGKASKLSGMGEVSPEKIMERRYKTGKVRKKIPGTSTYVTLDIKTDGKILQHFHDTNRTVTNRTTSSGRASYTGDELVHGLEGAEAEAFDRENPGKLLNKKKPLGDNAANKQVKMNSARRYVTGNESRTCTRFPF